MLQASDIACHRGSRELFRNISFTVDPGSVLRVQGENGAGKTSLLRIIAGLAAPAAGSVLWCGVSVAKRGARYVRDMALIGHANALKDELTPVENLRNALNVAGICISGNAVRAALRDDGLERTANLPVQWLSQGQKRRVALARLAFCSSRRLWVLDEPFSALDSASVARLSGRLEQHLAAGGMVIYTTHQEVAIAAPTRTLILQ
ncbi:MAG: cytochrome c biogenesis heme-transporting ATPase CcmA [Burkholderiales bacterium]